MKIIIVEKFQSLQNAFLDNFFNIASKFGEFFAFIIIFYLLYWCVGNKSAMRFLFTYLTGVALNQGVKHLFKRPRPYIASPNVIDKYSTTGYSFPSGHSASATLAFGGGWLQIKDKSSKQLKIFNIVVNCIIILLVMASRVYLGQHYLSDVICGTLIAILWLILAQKIYNWFGKNDHKALLLVAPVILLIAMFATNPFTVNSELTVLYIVCGLLLGVILGYYIDRTFIKQPPNSSIKFILIKLIIGAVITTSCLLLLISISKYLIVCLIGYCLLGLISTAGCSVIFEIINQKFFKKVK